MKKILKYKKTISVVLGIIFFVLIVYIVIFGRALKQEENHIKIFFVLPKVILTSDIARIDDKKCLAQSKDSFIKEMEQQGFIFVEQMGSGYFFQKNQNKYISTSRKYSSYFMVFTHPVLISDKK
jgi:hypothetical protein